MLVLVNVCVFTFAFCCFASTASALCLWQALVDGPDTGVPRHMIPFKRLALTDYKLGIQRNARAGTISKATKVVGHEMLLYVLYCRARGAAWCDEHFLLFLLLLRVKHINTMPVFATRVCGRFCLHVFEAFLCFDDVCSYLLSSPCC